MPSSVASEVEALDLLKDRFPANDNIEHILDQPTSRPAPPEPPRLVEEVPPSIRPYTSEEVSELKELADAVQAAVAKDWRAAMEMRGDAGREFMNLLSSPLSIPAMLKSIRSRARIFRNNLEDPALDRQLNEIEELVGRTERDFSADPEYSGLTEQYEVYKTTIKDDPLRFHLESNPHEISLLSEPLWNRYNAIINRMREAGDPRWWNAKKDMEGWIQAFDARIERAQVGEVPYPTLDDMEFISDIIKRWE